MKKILTAIAISIGFSSISQVVLLDEKFTSGIPANWSVINADNNTEGLAQFTDAWIKYTSVFDTCVASTSYYVDSNGDEDVLATSADFLITPQLSLLTFGNLLSWDAKSLDGSFPDGYEVLVSTTDGLEGSFTNVLKTVSAESPYWTTYTVNLAEYGFANQDVYIAFKNNTTNGYVLQLDNIKLTADDPASTIENSLNINVFPNPFINELNFEVKDFKNVSIYNVLGELMLISNQSKVNVSDLPKGYYISVVNVNGIESIIKLVK